MRIYEIQWHAGERSWVCANTVIEAIKVYCKRMDMDFNEFDGMDDIILLPRLKWPFYKINNTKSFSQYMRTAVLPDVITETFKNYVISNQALHNEIRSVQFSAKQPLKLLL